MARFHSIIGKTKGRFVSEKRWLREREIVERRVNKLGQEMRKAIRARDQARSEKVKKKWQRVIDKDRPQQATQLKTRAKLERQGDIVPKYRRVEVSLRFRDTLPRRSRSHSKNRLAMLKVVVSVTKKGVTKAQIERAVETAIRTGKRTKGIQLQFADWGAQRFVGGKVERSKGRLEKRGSTSLAEQLKPFAGLLRKDAVTRQEVDDVGAKRKSRSGTKSSSRRRPR
jgi:hypothetical protein